jgi:aminoglycoside 6'-N-acetyltransferase
MVPDSQAGTEQTRRSQALSDLQKETRMAGPKDGGAVANLATYQFRPMTSGDLPMVQGWLRAPEVAEWWGDPIEQLVTLTASMDDPLMRQWIVLLDGFPFAYVQAFPAHDWPQSHLTHLPLGTEAIDICIGAPSMLGVGHGTALLRQFACMLIGGGATAVVIDPEPDNLRARRSYARAGFVEDRIADTPDGPVVVMVLRN